MHAIMMTQLQRVLNVSSLRFLLIVPILFFTPGKKEKIVAAATFVRSLRVTLPLLYA